MKKKRNPLKWLIIIVLALIVFAVIGKKAGWIGGEEKKKVAVEKVKKRSLTEIVSASGKIQPEVEIKISPDVSGEIVELNVKEGDRVKKGELLVRILPDVYQSYVDRAVASMNSAKASLDNSRSRVLQAKSQLEREHASYDRSRKLFDEKLISASEWETAKSTYDVATAEVDAAEQSASGADFGVRSAEASVKEAQDNLRKTSIFAPVDGTVAKLNVEKGERVVGTSQMAGTEIMSLANLNEMEVSVDVNENDIMRVNNGDTANIEVDAYVGKKFKGVVTEVANSANIKGLSVDQVTNFTVKIRILRDSYEGMQDKVNVNRSVFNPGMSATVDIMTKKVADVLTVPIQSVATRDTSMHKFGKNEPGEMEMEDEDALKVTDAKEKEPDTLKDKKKDIECVFVVADNKVRLQAVEIGIQDNTNIEIKKGLKEGDVVVSAPYTAVAKQLNNGDAVQVVKKQDLFTGTKK